MFGNVYWYFLTHYSKKKNIPSFPKSETIGLHKLLKTEKLKKIKF